MSAPLHLRRCPQCNALAAADNQPFCGDCGLPLPALSGQVASGHLAQALPRSGRISDDPLMHTMTDAPTYTGTMMTELGAASGPQTAPAPLSGAMEASDLTQAGPPTSAGETSGAAGLPPTFGVGAPPYPLPTVLPPAQPVHTPPATTFPTWMTLALAGLAVLVVLEGLAIL